MWCAIAAAVGALVLTTFVGGYSESVRAYVQRFQADAAAALDGLKGTDMLERGRRHHERALLSKARAAASAQRAVEERLSGTKRVERASAFVRPCAASGGPSDVSSTCVILSFIVTFSGTA